MFLWSPFRGIQPTTEKQRRQGGGQVASWQGECATGTLYLQLEDYEVDLGQEMGQAVIPKAHPE